MSNIHFDVIAETRKCSEGLLSAGYPDWSSKLVDAIEAGATGSEIHMAIRYHLERLRQAEPRLPQSIEQEAKRIIGHIRSMGS